jgi:hypothetical protein
MRATNFRQNNNITVQEKCVALGKKYFLHKNAYSHIVALDPNNAQRTYLAKCAGTSRFTYNWALALWKQIYEAHKEDPLFEATENLFNGYTIVGAKVPNAEHEPKRRKH